ncbi:hypothetical protein CIB84_017754, partial [Bambusicola thoracicus]
MDFVSLLLLFFSTVAVSRAQVQQEPWAETSEDTGINITCSHPTIQANYIHWYRQLPGRAPTFLVSAVKASKDVSDPEGRLSVSADRRSSALWLAKPRLGDAAVYYCAVDPREAKPELRLGTNLIGRGGGTVASGPAGGAAAPPAGTARADIADMEHFCP